MEINIDVEDFISSHRIARLATTDSSGVPHLIPVCYVFDGSVFYSALDLKPKKVSFCKLKRVQNILNNPNVALVVDDYSEDWDKLAYVLVQGKAELITDGRPEQARAEAMLRDKYTQYLDFLTEGCPIIKIVPAHLVKWGRVFSEPKY